MKTTLIRAALALSLGALSLGTAAAAQIELYETGPAEDSSFLRFVNGGTQGLEVGASGSKAKLALDAAKPASDFMPVKADADIRGTLSRGGKEAPVSLKVSPGQFATVIALGEDAPTAEILREEPDDFNALKASLGFYVVDAACKDAGLQAMPRQVAIFEKAADRSVQRRQINPVALTVQLTCSGAATGEPLSLGTLEAGERYTVFVVPGPKGSRIFQAVDSLAR